MNAGGAKSTPLGGGTGGDWEAPEPSGQWRALYNG